MGGLGLVPLVLCLWHPWSLLWIGQSPHPAFHVAYCVCISENSFSQRGKEARNQRPVVILLGWGGCKDKNLAKYSAIYHKRVSTQSSGLPVYLPCHLCGEPEPLSLPLELQ